MFNDDLILLPSFDPPTYKVGSMNILKKSEKDNKQQQSAFEIETAKNVKVGEGS